MENLDHLLEIVYNRFLRDYLEYYHPDNFMNKNYTIEDGLKETYPEFHKKLEEKDD